MRLQETHPEPPDVAELRKACLDLAHETVGLKALLDDSYARLLGAFDREGAASSGGDQADMVVWMQSHDRASQILSNVSARLQLLGGGDPAALERAQALAARCPASAGEPDPGSVELF